MALFRTFRHVRHVKFPIGSQTRLLVTSVRPTGLQCHGHSTHSPHSLSLPLSVRHNSPSPLGLGLGLGLSHYNASICSMPCSTQYSAIPTSLQTHVWSINPRTLCSAAAAYKRGRGGRGGKQQQQQQQQQKQQQPQQKRRDRATLTAEELDPTLADQPLSIAGAARPNFGSGVYVPPGLAEEKRLLYKCDKKLTFLGLSVIAVTQSVMWSMYVDITNRMDVPPLEGFEFAQYFGPIGMGACVLFYVGITFFQRRFIAEMYLAPGGRDIVVSHYGWLGGLRPRTLQVSKLSIPQALNKDNVKRSGYFTVKVDGLYVRSQCACLCSDSSTLYDIASFN
jgi:TMEM70/TMEM186/TMEM223 protein family